MSPLWRPKLRRRIGASIHTGQLRVAGDSALTLAGTVGPLGIPFALWEAMSTPSAYKNGTGPFTSTVQADDASTIPPRLATAHSVGRSTFLHPWSSHVWSINAGGFDMPTWQARLASINTPAVRAAIATGLANKSCAAMVVIEEPQDSDYNGKIFRSTIDDCTRQVKAVFGASLPVGCNVTSYFRPQDGPYTDLDFTQSQFVYSAGAPWVNNPVSWRNGRLAESAASGVKWVAGINTANGGADFNAPSCPVPPTGGDSAVGDAGRCSIGTAATAAFARGQLIESALAVIGADPQGRRAVGLWFWRHAVEYYGRAAVQSGLVTIAAGCAASPTQSLLRGQP